MRLQTWRRSHDCALLYGSMNDELSLLALACGSFSAMGSGVGVGEVLFTYNISIY